MDKDQKIQELIDQYDEQVERLERAAQINMRNGKKVEAIRLQTRASSNKVFTIHLSQILEMDKEELNNSTHKSPLTQMSIAEVRDAAFNEYESLEDKIKPKSQFDFAEAFMRGVMWVHGLLVYQNKPMSREQRRVMQQNCDHDYQPITSVGEVVMMCSKPNCGKIR